MSKELTNQNKKYEKAINKAINNPKTKVKEKHLRLIILYTISEKEAETFWSVVLGFPYLNSKPVTWKLCYVLHEMLREGHSLCYRHIIRSQSVNLDSIGKAWYGLDNDFAKIIQRYAKLLEAKWWFQCRQPDFPSHLDASLTELQLIVKSDMNNLFQLLRNILEYWDRLLEFQETVFTSLLYGNCGREAWKCAVDPLILSILESSQLYNHSVKILFILLSSELHWDIRRFRELFRRLKSVYYSANIVQCRNIDVPVPSLPEKEPNLLMEIKFDLKSLRPNGIHPADKMPTFSSPELTEQIMALEQYGFVEQNLIVLSNYSSRKVNCSIL